MLKYRNIGCLFLLTSFLWIQSEVLNVNQNPSDLACSILKADSVSLCPLKGGQRAQIFKASHACVIRYINKENSLETREREIKMAHYAADMGFGPKILFADATSGVMVMECLDAIKPPRTLFDTPKWNKEIGRTISLLHKGPKQSIRARSIFDKCRRILKDTNAIFFEEFIPVDFIHTIINECEAIFATMPHSVCSHGDLHGGNLLYTSKGFRIIDYESIANDSPYIDLAFAAIENSSNYKNDRALLRGYFNRMPTKYETACLMVMKHIMYLYRGLIDISYCPEELIKQHMYDEEYVNYLSTAYKHGDFDIRNNDDFTRYCFSFLRQALSYFNSDYYEQDMYIISNQIKRELHNS